MKTLLAIDTSTSTGSVALLRGQEGGEAACLFERSFEAGRSHSSQLFVMLEEALRIVPAGQLSEIVVGLGPGSYAGVRIGLSAAVGLALTCHAKLIGIPSIAGLTEGDYAVIGDARRESHYVAVIRNGLMESDPELIPSSVLADRLATLPNELPRYATELAPAQLEQYQISLLTPCALRLARLAMANRGLITQEQLEPIYLREPHITLPKARPL